MLAEAEDIAFAMLLPFDAKLANRLANEPSVPYVKAGHDGTHPLPGQHQPQPRASEFTRPGVLPPLGVELRQDELVTDALKPLRYVDGWYTDDPDEFRFFTRDARGWSYRAQLAADARSWKPWAWWCMGLVPAGLGLLRKSPSLTVGGALWGALVLQKYTHMLRTVVRGFGERRVRSRWRRSARGARTDTW